MLLGCQFKSWSICSEFPSGCFLVYTARTRIPPPEVLMRVVRVGNWVCFFPLNIPTLVSCIVFDPSVNQVLLVFYISKLVLKVYLVTMLTFGLISSMLPSTSTKKSSKKVKLKICHAPLVICKGEIVTLLEIWRMQIDLLSSKMYISR